MNPFGANIQELLEQAQKIQEQVKKAQADLESKTVQATVGGGMVTATVSGNGLLKEIKIDHTVLEANDVQMLQDLVVSAVNEGVRKSKELVQEEVSRAAGGFAVPPFLQGLFKG